MVIFKCSLILQLSSLVEGTISFVSFAANDITALLVIRRIYQYSGFVFHSKFITSKTQSSHEMRSA